MIAVAVATIVCAGLVGLGLWWQHAPTLADKALAEIRVAGYQQTGRLDQSDPGGADSTGVYEGLPVARDEIPRIVTGPGVKVAARHASSAAVPFPGTLWVAGGTAPRGCELEIDEFQKTAQPYSWFGISASQLRQVRSGRLAVLLVTPICGTG
jgi:hypothetical protein